MLGWFRKLFGGSSGPPRLSTDTSNGGVYSGLRAQAPPLFHAGHGVLTQLQLGSGG
jgi:hypothetical protein